MERKKDYLLLCLFSSQKPNDVFSSAEQNYIFFTLANSVRYTCNFQLSFLMQVKDANFMGQYSIATPTC